MNQKDKLLLNEGMVFFAFGFALNGNKLPALIAGLLAIVTAVESHSIHALFKQKITVLLYLISELIIIRISHLDEVVPYVVFLSLSSLITSVLWLQSSEKVIGNLMKGMTVMMLFSYVLAFTMHELFYGRMYTMILITLIFLPSCLGYMIREWRYYAHKKLHPDSRKHVPAIE